MDIQAVKLGHGNRLPKPGEEFFLRPGISKSGRTRFPCVTITPDGNPAKVGYSIRSSANLTSLAVGQIWRVRAARIRQSREMDESGHPWIFVRIDLDEAYEHLVGHFDYHTMEWTVHRYEELNGDPIIKVPARVQYTEYRSEYSGSWQIGSYPEVVDTGSGKVIVRFSPWSTRKCEEADFDGIPSLPEDDGVLMNRERDTKKFIKLIGPPISS